MCGRLSQYSGIHDFVAALSIPRALASSVGGARRYGNRIPPRTLWVRLLGLRPIE